MAICMRLRPDSCIRAPPEQLTMTRGRSRSVAISMVRAKTSPTTEPIEPIMKVRSMQARATWRPLTKPTPAMIASFSPVRICSASRRSR